MTDLTILLLGALVAIDIAIYAISRLDKRSGCFYALLMTVDTFLAGTVLLARFG